MSDAIKCHWCGGACEVNEWARLHDVAHNVVCLNVDCLAEGPLAATPEAAVAAWERVAAKPVWTTEPPKGPQACRVRPGGSTGLGHIIDVDELLLSLLAEVPGRYEFAEVLTPVEPAPAGEE